MIKRLAVFSIAEEGIRLTFGTAIHEIDENAVEIIDQHAYVFHSDKTLDEIWDILTHTGFDSSKDEFWILTLDRPFTGFGAVKDYLKEFLLK